MNSAKRVSEIKKNIAIMGGTFDPIHNGHIETAKETAAWLNVEQLFFLPAHLPPHKNTTTASAMHRTAMVNLVCQQQPLFKLDNRELKRHSASYTVTSLREIKQEQPNSRVFFIIGMDSFLNFTLWHQWQTILSLCHIVVNIRPGYQLNQINTATQELLKNHQIDDLAEIKQQDAGGIIFHQNQSLNISSSEIRQQLLSNNKHNNHLTECVHHYIIEKKLYQK
ncbi:MULTISPECIES: nicotinate-nucleotide adenylyltransferase [unclassified Colwellia]|jgi:nicotinate-nucleotide adenylyltransferase|uniref:nicotinate-nucleotide adenylyltransferase n=3 Tax=Colwellia TaxID=28228 RepID=UPI0015F3F886|nr:MULTISPECIES: nicotinate-nucleotide adenylyltransferase [unclassified Colwellia]MBA6337798.1 nicotinate-nucleotide adenylyltransferase [Colwellia sp. BRX8-7]MBA6348879.1 nicotinate-nucleotide adenylyltransferase [Colwellia sp. BRX8-9]MBA6352189.1 nicotinate-nucleotide adenylyltransferase [Colwellia sp. BRX9-1]MBA6379607.1 nicotinate-nucleotide adenylyltransferase [Colwellia sp. BRX10-7]MBA6386204.1 nicotinate-nucleotide adenylyltransferase [Colwellia sp. BRX10-2]